MGAILAGTAGWTDRSLERCGRFYPPSAKDAEARLRFYASQLPMVEVDSTHYAPLAKRNAELWAARTPAGFVFDIKAHALITGHPSRPAALPSDLRAALPPSLCMAERLGPGEVPSSIVDEVAARFCDALSPLHQAGKLGAVLLQMPPWLEAGREGARAIAQAASRMGGLPVAVELRHPSWMYGGFRLRTEQFLRRLGASLVCTEGPPELPSALTPALLVTSPKLAVVRLHGPRPLDGRSAPRRRYPPEQLSAWGKRARALAEQADAVHVVFANVFEDSAVRDALSLTMALDLPRPRPEQLSFDEALL